MGRGCARTCARSRRGGRALRRATGAHSFTSGPRDGHAVSHVTRRLVEAERYSVCIITVVIGDFKSCLPLLFSSRGNKTRNVRRRRFPALYYMFFSHLIKHFLSTELRLFLYRHVVSRGNSRDASGLCREIARVSRDLVGRAVVLDGGALGSGGLGPATLSTRQVVREGPGASASWCRETCCISFL